MATKVAINSAMLQWALERSGKPASVARKFPKLKDWQSGKSQPTLKQLESFAKETSTPFGFLFLAEPPQEQLSIPHFRTLDDKKSGRPSPDLMEVVTTLEQRQAWLRDYFLEKDAEPLKFVRTARVADNSKVVAQEIRKALGLEHGWASQLSSWTKALDELRKRTEEIGIVVNVSGVVGNNNRRILDPSEFRGFVLIDDFAPFIFINGADGKAAQMFTLAHELAHVWLGSSAAFDLRELQPAADQTELACNRIAAEFLVPEDELRSYWPSARKSDTPYDEIARRFKVSVLVAARRTQDLGLISKPEFLEFYAQWLQRERRKKDNKEDSGGNFYATQNVRIGRVFAEAVVRAAKEGALLYRDAYRLTGLYGNTFDSFSKEIFRGERR